MLVTVLFTTSCRSSRPTVEQRQTERVFDTVRELVVQRDTVREQVTVRDTLRETTTITLNAEGDTLRRETERERISDRTRERASATQQVSTSESGHREATASEEKQTVEEKPKDWRKIFQWGVVAGWLCGVIGAIGIIRIIRQIRK